MSVTVFVQRAVNGKTEIIQMQKTDQFLKIFEILNERTEIEKEHIRLLHKCKEYRHDLPEAKKKIQEITSDTKLN